MTRTVRLAGLTAAGLTMALLVVVAGAQPPAPGPFPGGPGMFPGAPVGLTLLGRPEVRKELGTSEAQNKQLDALAAEAQAAVRGAFDGPPGEDVRKKIEEAAKAAEGKLAKVLTARQNDRLAQLRVQREGVAALSRPDVMEKLGLNKEQQGQVRQAAEGLDSFPPPSPDERKKALTTALAALTDKQKAAWTNLTGKEFTFPDGPGGFGPGGFGPGGFGPGGFGPGGFGPGGFGKGKGKGGPGGFPGGPGGPGGMGEVRKLVKRFDKDGDGRLNREEREAARESVQRDGGFGKGGFGKGGKGGFGKENEPTKEGPRVAPADVKTYPDADFYDPKVLRTLFLDFDDRDWEAEMTDFYHTDVEVPAALTVDGKKYPGVGVRFRGMSSYMAVRAGQKRSLNVSVDFTEKGQGVKGYKTLNLLNGHDDPSLLSTVLYSHVARQYLPAPKANLVKVVINGESWGVYTNVQQFNKKFLTENYKTGKGARWKVQGSPGGGGGLDYLGDNVESYKGRYRLKSEENPDDWKALVNLCRVLNQTPPDKLESALAPILDIDGALRFLAVDVALINNDGYWVRASDYSIFKDGKGVFHVLPHDMNEAFTGAMGGPGGFGGPGGPGGFGGPGGPGMGPRGGGLTLDPLVGLEDLRKPLRSRLLAVPALRAKYLEYVKAIAENSLDWKKLGPVVAGYRELISREVEADTRKLTSHAAFLRATADDAVAEAPGGRGRGLSLRAFADGRRKFLLEHSHVKNPSAPIGKGAATKEDRKP